LDDFGEPLPTDRFDQQKLLVKLIKDFTNGFQCIIMGTYETNLPAISLPNHNTTMHHTQTPHRHVHASIHKLAQEYSAQNLGFFGSFFFECTYIIQTKLAAEDTFGAAQIRKLYVQKFGAEVQRINISELSNDRIERVRFSLLFFLHFFFFLYFILKFYFCLKKLTSGIPS
jgi:hypothetical protein